ncbi:hypothetical protein LINPERHAP2_LOCUS3685 [Linum perenne]
MMLLLSPLIIICRCINRSSSLFWSPVLVEMLVELFVLSSNSNSLTSWMPWDSEVASGCYGMTAISESMFSPPLISLSIRVLTGIQDVLALPRLSTLRPRWSIAAPFGRCCVTSPPPPLPLSSLAHPPPPPPPPPPLSSLAHPWRF